MTEDDQKIVYDFLNNSPANDHDGNEIFPIIFKISATDTNLGVNLIDSFTIRYDNQVFSKDEGQNYIKNKFR